MEWKQKERKVEEMERQGKRSEDRGREEEGREEMGVQNIAEIPRFLLNFEFQASGCSLEAAVSTPFVHQSQIWHV